MHEYANIKDAAVKLVDEGRSFIPRIDLLASLEFQMDYQRWYSLSCKLIERLMPDRLNEFKACYEDSSDDSMSRYFLKIGGFYFSFQDKLGNYIEIFKRQLSILSGIVSSMDSVLYDIQNQVYYEYQEDALENARQVLIIDPRAAGVIARLVIEKHLKNLAEEKKLEVKSRFSSPGIQDYIIALRSASVIQEVEKKKLDYLKEIGNKCAHDKGSDPSEAEVKELIDGAKWCVSNLFI